MSESRSVITGVTGQDGAYLARLLLSRGHRVIGAYRRTSAQNFWRLTELDLLDHPSFELVEYDVTDPGSAIRMLDRFAPHYVYNLAAQSFVGVSFDKPTTTAEITGLGTLHLLEAIRTVDTGIRFYQASTSEMFGKVQQIPQTERTPFYPRSPYGVAKLFAHWTTVNYRESYDLFATCGILFNHESPLRGVEFVTRKITDGLARIRAGKLEYLELGNLDAERDWGYAPDYVEGMTRILEAENPETYVLATGRSTTVREFAAGAALEAGFELEWQGEGSQEVGVDRESGQTLIRVSESLYRPAEVDQLLGDASRAESELGWRPETSLDRMCAEMVCADLRRHGIEAR
jgi:GDPmannose 4,6-dehydratase